MKPTASIGRVGVGYQSNTVIFDSVCCMNDLVYPFRDGGLGAVTDSIVFDTVFYMNDLVHAIRHAGLGAVPGTIIIDNVCYIKKLVHAFRNADVGAVTTTIIIDGVVYECRSTRIQKCGSGCCDKHHRIRYRVLCEPMISCTHSEMRDWVL